MSLTDLVEQVRQLKLEHPSAATMDWFDCAYLVLCEQFQVEPCKAEIEELAKAAKPSTESGSTVNEEWESADFPHELQTKGGRRIVHKSEPMAG